MGLCATGTFSGYPERSRSEITVLLGVGLTPALAPVHPLAGRRLLRQTPPDPVLRHLGRGNWVFSSNARLPIRSAACSNLAR